MTEATRDATPARMRHGVRCWRPSFVSWRGAYQPGAICSRTTDKQSYKCANRRHSGKADRERFTIVANKRREH